jgi:ABC-2 type transport system permease protein
MGGSAASIPTVAPVRVAGGRVTDDVRAIRVVWKRELIRYTRDRARIISGLAQPLVFLLILGTGLASLIPSVGGFDYRTFMFPGVVAMTMLFTAVFASISIVWDREFGFLREMLVAPARRGSVVVGKCVGGATVATIQGAIMLALAGLVHVPYDPVLLILLLLEMALGALMLTSIGLVVATRMKRVESFQVVIQFLVLPMFFLSGAVFPLNGLPHWLTALTRLNPLSYLVDAMRRTLFAFIDVPDAVRASLNPGITWNGWTVPVALELGIVAGVGAVLLAIAVRRFAKVD